MSEQPGERYDESLQPEELPPDEPLAADDPGGARHERDSLADREERMEPDVGEEPSGGGSEPGTVVEGGSRPTDTGDGDEVQVPVEGEGEAGPLAPDDELTGDETTRDVATERAPAPAEEAAMHVEEEADRGRG